jgi:predicted RNase H-like HicB family nuclease
MRGKTEMNTYGFPVSLEPDEEGWRAFYPPWEEIGASTWGESREEALKNIQEVLAMIVEEFAESGQQIPVPDNVKIFEGPLVTVSL